MGIPFPCTSVEQIAFAKVIKLPLIQSLQSDRRETSQGKLDKDKIVKDFR